MEISVGNKYRFKCYQFLEYPVVLVVFHLSLLVHSYPSCAVSSLVFFLLLCFTGAPAFQNASPEIPKSYSAHTY